MIRTALGTLAGKLALAGVALATVGGTTGAAAAGALPKPIQHTVAVAADSVGIAVPDPATDIAPTEEPTAEETNHGQDVSAVAHDDTLEGADHGAAVSEAAQDNHGAEMREAKAGDEETAEVADGSESDTLEAPEAPEPADTVEAPEAPEPADTVEAPEAPEAPEAGDGADNG